MIVFGLFVIAEWCTGQTRQNENYLKKAFRKFYFHHQLKNTGIKTNNIKYIKIK